MPMPRRRHEVASYRDSKGRNAYRRSRGRELIITLSQHACPSFIFADLATADSPRHEFH